MHHIDSEVIPHMYVSALFDQQLRQSQVASERREMQSSEAIFVRLVVHPKLYLFVSHCLLYAVH